MNDQMGHVMIERLGGFGGFPRTGVIGDGDVAQCDALVILILVEGEGVVLRGGVGDIGGLARLLGGEILRGPAEHIGGGGLAAEFGVEHRDARVVAAQQADDIEVRVKAQMGERGAGGGFGQAFQPGLQPAVVFDLCLCQHVDAMQPE